MINCILLSNFMKVLNLFIFIFFNSTYFLSQIPFSEIVKCFDSDSIKTLENLKSKEKYRIESKEKFGKELEIYSFVYDVKPTIKKKLFFGEYYFFELKKNCNFIKELKTKFSYLNDNNKSKKSLNNLKSIHYTLIARKKDTKEVNITFIVQMKNENFAKTFYDAVKNPNVFRKNLFAIRKNNIVIVFYSNYFQILSSEISRCIAFNLKADEYFNYLI